MNKNEYEKFLKAHDAIRINNHVIYSSVSKIGYICYSAYNIIEMEGEFFINETPEISFRDEKALQRCIDFAMSKN